MKISLKTFQKIRIVFICIISFLISESIIFHNYLLPIIIVAIGSLVLFYLRSKVTEIIADERDYVIAGKAAILTIQVFAWIGVIAMFLCYYLSDTNPQYQMIAQTLGFLVCFLMVLYSFLFSFYTKGGKFDKRFLFYSIFLIFLVGFFLFLFFVKLFFIQSTGKPFEFSVEKVLNISCHQDNECKTPNEYLIRSNCPYTSKCIENKCNVICPNF